ncbi:helix-turn-helix domain-containing protein [Nitrosococcus oceani]|uniref:helix-turn-helix domain-containing protein n=1 Tax=Nitrosococcus oceani TaxID=1229 RepID=UPI0002D8E2C5|nr:helix-turn-helix domain-containing protein [Nitrosococcus oceani]
MKAYQFRIYPNTDQQDLMNKHFGCVRHIFNWALELKDKHYKGTQKSLSKSEIQSLLVRAKKKINPGSRKSITKVCSLPRSILKPPSQTFSKAEASFPSSRRKILLPNPFNALSMSALILI